MIKVVDFVDKYLEEVIINSYANDYIAVSYQYYPSSSVNLISFDLHVTRLDKEDDAILDIKFTRNTASTIFISFNKRDSSLNNGWIEVEVEDDISIVDFKALLDDFEKRLAEIILQS